VTDHLSAIEGPQKQLLKATVTVVAKRGYTATTTAHIAHQASVSIDTFHALFSSKQKAILAVLRDSSEHTLYRVKAAYQSEETWPDRIYSAMKELVDLIVSNPSLARVIFVEVQTAGAQAMVELQQCIHRYTDFLIPNKHETSNDIKVPDGVPDQVIGAVFFIIYNKIASDELEHLPDLLPDLVEIVLIPYIGHQRASNVLKAHEPKAHGRKHSRAPRKPAASRTPLT
jgi:AcrR family transcriptional regulator